MPMLMNQRRVASSAPESASTAPGRRSLTFGAIAVAFLLAAGAAGFMSTRWSDEQRQLAQATEAFDLLDVRVDLLRPAQDEFVLRLIAPLGAATDDQVAAATLEREQAVETALERLRVIEAGDASTRQEARRFRSELESFTSFVDEATPDDLYDLVLLTEFAGEDARVGGSERTSGLGELSSLDQLVTLLLGEAAVLFYIQDPSSRGVSALDQGVADHIETMRDFIAEAGGYLGPEESAPVEFAVIPSEIAAELAPRATAAINARIRATSLWDVDQWIQAWEGDEVEAPPVDFGTLVNESLGARDDIRSIIDDRLVDETDRIESRTSTIATSVAALRIGSAVLLLLAVAAAWVAIQSMRRRSQHLLAQASTDPLTGVGNRHMLTSAAEVALSNPSYTDHLAVMIDLDRFKMTNDTYGHAVGDRLLVAVAERLTELVESLDLADGLVVRLGGDEFAVFLHHTGPIDTDRIRRSVEAIRRTTVSTETGDEITVELSYGIAHTLGPVALSQLLDAADLEAYSEKAARRERSETPTISADGITIRS